MTTAAKHLSDPRLLRQEIRAGRFTAPTAGVGGDDSLAAMVKNELLKDRSRGQFLCSAQRRQIG